MGEGEGASMASSCHHCDEGEGEGEGEDVHCCIIVAVRWPRTRWVRVVAWRWHRHVIVMTRLRRGLGRVVVIMRG